MEQTNGSALSVYVSVSLCCVAVCLYVSLFLRVSLCVSVILYVSLCVSVSLCVCLCVSPHVSMCFCVFLFVSFVSLCVSMCVCMCLSVSLYVSVSPSYTRCKTVKIYAVFFGVFTPCSLVGIC